MKALKSPLARKVLADPKGQGLLRRFLTSSTSGREAVDVVIEVKDDAGNKRTLRPEFVAKAS